MLTDASDYRVLPRAYCWYSPCHFSLLRIRIICNLFWLIILCNLLYFVHRSTSCLNKVVWKLTMHVVWFGLVVRCQTHTGDAHACSVTLYRTIKKNTICWVSHCSCDPETLWLVWFCRQKNIQSITVIFMWGGASSCACASFMLVSSVNWLSDHS